MAPFSDRQSLMPSFLYTSSFTSKPMNLHKMAADSSSPSPASAPNGGFMNPAPDEPENDMYLPEFYAASVVGGILGSGLPHMAVTPLDIVKCNMQINSAKYTSISSGFRVILKEQGPKGFFRGWAPTLLGNSAHIAFRFGFNVFLKKYYSDFAGPENVVKNRHLIYLAASVSAEVLADVVLCPMEALKVRVQTQPGFARGLFDGLPKFVRSEGALGLYRGLGPLLGREIPYSMTKFASIEAIEALLYVHAIRTPDECSKPFHFGLSFAGGYLAGILSAIVSHPADNLFSFINHAKGATVGDAVKQLGTWGLFTRGLAPRIVMIGTVTGAQWVMYDAYNVLYDMATTDGPAPAAAIETAK